MSLEGHLTTRQAADHLGIHPSTLLHLMRDGVVQGVRKGKWWYIPVDAVVAYQAKLEAALSLSIPYKVEVLAKEIVAEHPDIALME